MSWSYRSDRSDEVYANQPGPAVVAGDSQADSPGVAAGKTKVYAVDGAIDVRSHNAVLTKGSAAAMTLAAPTSDGIEIKIIAGSSFAHVVTATGLINDGLTGVPHNSVTTLAFLGSGAILVSYAGKWNLVARN